MKLDSYCPPNQPFVDIAIDVFKTQSDAAIQPLKGFLTILPTPTCVRRVLLEAIQHLATSDPDVCRWVLRHAQALEPELNLDTIANQVIIDALQQRNCTSPEDFRLEPNGSLMLSGRAKDILVASRSAWVCLLLEEMLQNHDDATLLQSSDANS